MEETHYQYETRRLFGSLQCTHDHDKSNTAVSVDTYTYTHIHTHIMYIIYTHILCTNNVYYSSLIPCCNDTYSVSNCLHEF